jgi:hypothetical protein
MQRKGFEGRRGEASESPAFFQVLKFEFAACKVAIESQPEIVLLGQRYAYWGMPLLGVARQTDNRVECAGD